MAVLNFNPRSHKGSDQHIVPRHKQDIISIHAPTRGATGEDGTDGRVTPISIHAPTRGATDLQQTLYKKLEISIHAPTRGATGEVYQGTLEAIFQSTLPQGERPFDDYIVYDNRHFNPRSHKGSDGYGHKRIIRVEQFQSTLPQGERRGFTGIYLGRDGFQSTLPQGERPFFPCL